MSKSPLDPLLGINKFSAYLLKYFLLVFLYTSVVVLLGINYLVTLGIFSFFILIVFVISAQTRRSPSYRFRMTWEAQKKQKMAPSPPQKEHILTSLLLLIIPVLLIWNGIDGLISGEVFVPFAGRFSNFYIKFDNDPFLFSMSVVSLFLLGMALLWGLIVDIWERFTT
jgi:hypothetical protein